MSRRLFIIVVLCLSASCGRAQFLGWEQLTGHPYIYTTPSGPLYRYSDRARNVAAFSDRFVVPVMGYSPYYNPVQAIQNYCYLHVYDYEGNWLATADTIRGQVGDGLAYRYTDSTYLLQLNYDYGTNQNPRYDSGQNGGFVLEERSLSGRVLWHRSYQNETPGMGLDLTVRPGGRGFIQAATVNQDRRGADSLMLQRYDREGRFLGQASYAGLRLLSFPLFLTEPERNLRGEVSGPYPA